MSEKLRLDSHLPEVSYNAHRNTNNVNAKFGSRFDFVISPGTDSVQSGTDGIYHDNSASYIVGIAPAFTRKSDDGDVDLIFVGAGVEARVAHR